MSNFFKGGKKFRKISRGEGPLRMVSREEEGTEVNENSNSYIVTRPYVPINCGKTHPK